MLTIDKLYTWFSGKKRAIRAVDGVSFSIAAGQTYALLGESGCGKTVTALSILRLLNDAKLARVSGHIKYKDIDLAELPEYKMRTIRGKKIAMIFQEPMTALNPVLRIDEQLAEVMGDYSAMAPLLESVGISEAESRLKQYPHELSGGMKQRVVIAMAIAARPDVLIADEPTTALDVTTQAQVMTLLKEMQQKYGMAMLLITHDLGVVSNIADQVGIMYAGQLLEQGSCDEVFHHPSHPYTQKLLESLPNFNKRGYKLAMLEGEVPELDKEHRGCRFVERCAYRQDDCDDQAIAMQDMGATHQVRCRYPLTTSNSVIYDKLAAQDKKADTIYQVQNLKVYFPIRRGLFKRTVATVRAVDDLSFKLYRGQTLALVGESGCGKTTSGRAMIGLEHTDGGRLEYEGIDLRVAGFNKKLRSDIQMIFQDPYSSMNPRMTVREIIGEGAIALGVWRKIDEAKIIDLLHSVGLSSSHIDRYPHQFSGGQRQRIAIARALAVEPEILICDEPTSALDVSVQAQVLNLLRELQIAKNLAYFFITHNLTVVSWLADEIAVMYLGKIVEQGRADEILHQARHPYTQALIAAIPEIDKQTEQNFESGEPPSPLNPPMGCHFHPRCPQVMDVCRQQYPAVREVSRTHVCACFLT